MADLATFRARADNLDYVARRIIENDPPDRSAKPFEGADVQIDPGTDLLVKNDFGIHGTAERHGHHEDRGFAEALRQGIEHFADVAEIDRLAVLRQGASQRG